MIRFSDDNLAEMNQYLSKLRSRSEDVTGYLHFLSGEMAMDERFLELLDGQEIYEALIRMKYQAQELSDRITRLASLHSEMSDE